MSNILNIFKSSDNNSKLMEEYHQICNNIKLFNAILNKKYPADKTTDLINRVLPNTTSTVNERVSQNLSKQREVPLNASQIEDLKYTIASSLATKWIMDNSKYCKEYMESLKKTGGKRKLKKQTKPKRAKPRRKKNLKVK